MKRNNTDLILADSLLEIAKTKDVDKITIKEIVDNCGLSSQTFYNHFADKYALILWIHQSFGDELIKKLENGEITTREMSIQNLDFYSRHASFMLNALENTHGVDSYRVMSSENAINVIEGYIKRHFNVKELSKTEKYHLRMFVYSVTQICEYWAANGTTIPTDEMSDIILQATPDSLKKYLF